MKINNLKVNGYGKLKNKEIDLKNNINIIHGKNETGKSTLLSFIKSMFYGASKNKNGKDISDREKYKPWNGEVYSGKISYTLDNGKEYEIQREFKKTNPIIYDENLNDITKNFVNDKSKGIDILGEQIAIDEDTFDNTVITCQDEIKMSKAGQNHIIQKISNIVSTGDESVSYKKTMENLNKAQNEQVGTARTTQKPINNVESKIEKLEKERDDLENYKRLIEDNSFDVNDVQKNLDDETNKLEFLNKYKAELDENKSYYTEIDVNKNMAKSYDSKIEDLENKLEKSSNEVEKKGRKKKNFGKNCALIAVLTIACILTIFIKAFIVVPIVIGVLDVISIVLTINGVVKFRKEKRAELEDAEEFSNRLKQEIEILNKNKEEINEKTSHKEEEINSKIEEENIKLYREFNSKLDDAFLSDAFNMSYDDILSSIKNRGERVNELKMDLYSKQTEKHNMEEKLNDLSKIEEELADALEEKKELESLNNSYNIAKECMEEAYEKVRQGISPEFTNELCSLVSSISDGKYNKIRFSDEDGLTVEIEDGRYIKAEDLSIGTIDQMYLSLRLSSLNTVSSENMPAILDESFVYFDDDRLKNILKFLNENYKDKQFIILTCSKREMKVLDDLKISYNLINL